VDGQLRVELADLRGWAGQVDRAGDDCAYLAAYLRTFVPDGDFGRILSLITSEYEQLVERAHTWLEESGRRLGTAGGALHLCAARYARTDGLVARDLGPAVSADDGRVSRRFRDTATATPVAPVCEGEVLPVVSLGWGFEQVCDFMAHWGGPDLRAELVDLVAGDVGKALGQASAWEHAGESLAAVRANLVVGSAAAARTWQGRAATSARDHVQEWVDQLGLKSDALDQVAQHLRDAVTQAVDVAQLVADVIQQLIAAVAAGYGFAAIPIFGQVQLVNKGKDLLRLVLDARKVILVFWTFLVALRDCFVLLADGFSAASLPDAAELPWGTR